MDDLRTVGGTLRPLLDRVSSDRTLMLAIRRDYINIYYRGGSILRLTEIAERTYEAAFDWNYNGADERHPDLPQRIEHADAALEWAVAFGSLKAMMDRYLSEHRKPEREFQQVLAMENNLSVVSNESEYFIVDIEVAGSGIDARFDLVGVRWSAGDRKWSTLMCPVIIEMKCGDGALEGSAGIVKHLADIETFLSESGKYREFVDTIQSQFNQLDELGLLDFNRTADWKAVKIDASRRPEVLIVLASHNPRSTKLEQILASPELERFSRSPTFNLRFFVSSFAGYALHADCMLTLEEFRDVLGRRRSQGHGSDRNQ